MLLLFISSGICCPGLKTVLAVSAPIAKQGVLDLSNWNLEKDGNIKLDGQWEFYWKQLLKPGDFEADTVPPRSGFFKMPKSWNDYELKGKRLSGDGYATFRLKIITNDPKGIYALKILEQSTAYSLWVDDILLVSAGKVGVSRESMIPQYLPQTVNFQNSTSSFYIVLQVSNFFHRKGGFWFPTELGTERQIQRKYLEFQSFELLLMGVLLIMGIYHFGLYILRRNDRSTLYFCFFCMVLMVRILFTGERFSNFIFPNLSWEFSVKMEYLTLFLPMPIFFAFVKTLYPDETSTKFHWLSNALAFLFSLIVIFTPARISSHTTIPYQVIMILFLFYGMYVLFLALFRKREGAALFIIGLFFLALATINDILFQNEVIQTGNLFAFGLFVFILAQSLILSSRFSKAFAIVETQSDELKENVLELKKLDRIKDEFLANTSHELKTPLHGIIGLSETMIEGAAGRLTRKAKVNLSMIAKSGRRLAGLINDILDYSKLKNQELELNLKPVDLEAMLDLVVSIFQPSINEKKLSVKISISESIPALKADENRLQQILFNLLGNAVKYTHSGGIWISTELKDSFVEICVKDTGIGIPEDQFRSIFVSFTQGENVNRRKYDGSGIGLTLTRYLIELHGGNIGVESKIGEGSSFIFTIPCYTEKIAQKVAKTTSNKLPATIAQLSLTASNGDFSPAEPDKTELENCCGFDFSVLIVDDDPINLLIVANYLNLQNISTSTASSGVEALELLEQGATPDVMLLDIMMPEMTGIETCRIIRLKRPSYQLPIIFLTAKNQVADMEEAFNMGGNDYLVKPFSNRELLVRLQNQFQLLRFKKQMDSLRDFSNQINLFESREQLFYHMLKEISAQLFLTEGTLYFDGNLVTAIRNHSRKPYFPSILNQDIIPSIHWEQSGVTVFENLAIDHPILDLFGSKKFAALFCGQLILIRFGEMDDFVMGLFRKNEELVFNRAEVEYIENLVGQIRRTNQDRSKILSDKELFKAVNIIEPFLDRVLYIKSLPPYCTISFDSPQETDKEIRISLNRLADYFAESQLLRVHRSIMINPLKVERVEKKGRNHYVKFLNSCQTGAEIPVSRSFVQTKKSQFPAWFS